ncbi:MAG: glycosyltransferase family 4 protein, partial [Massilia sp.]
IHNFIQYDALARHAALEPCVDAGSVALVGRIDVGKGFGEFLAAVAPRLLPGITIRIIGDGPLKRYLAECYAGPQIEFLGWQPYPQVIRLAARSQLCVVPSVCEEACSTTVLEALAIGKPCLALARGGTPELRAYQLYDGQLQLADNMEQLVTLMLTQLAQAGQPAQPARPAQPAQPAQAVQKAQEAQVQKAQEAQEAQEAQSTQAPQTNPEPQLAAATKPAGPMPPASVFGADAARILPTLLDLYAE